MGERGTLCGLCPRNNSSAYERGHRATFLSKLAWPLVQVSLILYIVSFSSSNWCDGVATEAGVNGRIYAGAWKACLSTEVNTTLHPSALPVAICSDTASYIVDGLKTGWVAAWRAFLILSFLLLLLTSALLTIYVFGGRALNHSTFPLFFGFTTGFASSMFGALSLLVFYVQSGKAPELRGVSYGWAPGVNIAAVVTISYTIFLILAEHMEITTFRAARKAWRRKQHATLSHDDTTFPPPESSATWGSATQTGNGSGHEAAVTVTTPRAEVVTTTTTCGVPPDAAGRVQEPPSGGSMGAQGQLPPAVVMFQTSSRSSQDTPGRAAVTVSASTEPTASAAPTASATPTAPTASAEPPVSAAQTASAVLMASAPSAQDILQPDYRAVRKTVLPPLSSNTNWSGNNQSATQSAAVGEDEEHRFRFRKVTLRKNRRPSQIDPGNLTS